MNTIQDGVGAHRRDELSNNKDETNQGGALVPESLVPPVTESRIAQGGSQLAVAQGRWRSRAFEWSLLGLYLLLLALVTSRHAMAGDEMQAWLIARDSNSLAELFHHMRYEGHPALWQLILYIPAHISWNPISMHAINYVFAVAEAWLILSARKLHWSIRALAVFSFFVFYQYGLYARNYMLAMLLLTAAARCLLGERQHRKLGILFIALSINTHFFAIPIAAVLFIQMYCLPRMKALKGPGRLFRDLEFQAASLVLIASVLAAYLTIRPPADIYTPQFEFGHRSLPYYFLATEGQAWQGLIPGNQLLARVGDWLSSHHHPIGIGAAAGLSLALFLIVTVALQTVQARSIFLIACTLEILAMGATVHRPEIHHLGLIFAAFLIGLLVDAYTVPVRISRPWLPKPVSLGVILVILGMQTAKAATKSWFEWSLNNPADKETISWLRQSGLDMNPMVVMKPDLSGTELLGYLERPSAYYPACRCMGSFIVFRAGRDIDRIVTAGELDDISRASQLPVIVISGSELSAQTCISLRLQELRAFRKPSAWWDTFYVYQRLGNVPHG
jgi:hypothetical protein